jgi:hypothetical protein
MTKPFPEDRDAVRVQQNLKLHIQDLRSGAIFEARMFNYSSQGIYFESDAALLKGTKIYINMQNEQSSCLSGILENFYGDVIWREKLKHGFYKFGYGVQLHADLRKHPRKPFFQSIRLGTRNDRYEATTRDISASGVFIATEEKLEIGQLMKLDLFLKNGDIIKVSGQIVRLEENGFGVKFKKII